MNTKYLIAVVVAVAAVGAAAGAWVLSGDDDAAAQVDLPKEMSVKSLKEMSKDPDRMVETMGRMWDKRDEYTEEQRRAMRRNMGEVMRERMQANLDEYFDAETEEDKVAVLDRHIDEMQEWMKRFEELRKQREAEREARGEDAEAEREERRREWANQSTEERKERSEGRSPDEMVRMMTYFGAIRSRATARGIDMPGPGGGRWRGPRGRGGG